MTRLVALDITPGPSLVENITAAFDRGEAITVVDTTAPRLRQQERLDVAQPHVIRNLEGDFPYNPDAPLLESDDRLVMTTSGTTGTPRAIVHNLDNLQASCDAVGKRLRTCQGAHWLCALSPAYIGGLAIITRSLLGSLGLTVVPRFGAQEVARALKLGATHTAAVTAVLRRLDLSDFRAVLLGAGPPPETMPTNAIATYGLTETGSGVVYNGVPLDTVECRIVDNEVQLRGPMIASRDRAGTALVDQQGWLHTGDFGSYDTQGKLIVHGRMGDMINTGGHLVNPATVEDAILRTFADEITDVCVLGTPDPVWHQVVTAVVVSSRQFSLNDLQEQLLDQLASFELPRNLVYRDAIPRTDTGKPRRAYLAGTLRIKDHGNTRTG